MKTAEQHVPKAGIWMDKFARGAIPWTRVALYITLALGFFMLGFVPMWLKVSQAVEQRNVAQREVRLTQLENSLASATVEVQRGNYELARQTTSDFYSNLHPLLDAQDLSVFTSSQRNKLEPLLTQRDEVITLLARSDPAASDRLFAIYTSFKKLNNGVGK